MPSLLFCKARPRPVALVDDGSFVCLLSRIVRLVSTVFRTAGLPALAQLLVHKYTCWSVGSCSVEALVRRVGFRPVFRPVGYRPGIVGYRPVAS